MREILLQQTENKKLGDGQVDVYSALVLKNDRSPEVTPRNGF